MAHIIMRGRGGRRHEVEFGARTRVEVHVGIEAVELVVQCEDDSVPQGQRPFALVNISRDAFSAALAAAHSGAKSSPQLRVVSKSPEETEE